MTQLANTQSEYFCHRLNRSNVQVAPNIVNLNLLTIDMPHMVVARAWSLVPKTSGFRKTSELVILRRGELKPAGEVWIPHQEAGRFERTRALLAQRR